MPKPSKIEILRHSCAHVLAAAVLEMFPKTKFAIGPVIENGFYYDFDFQGTVPALRGLSPDDLPKIEKKMKEIIKKDLKFKKEQWSADKAVRYFELSNQNYKIELIEELAGLRLNSKKNQTSKTESKRKLDNSSKVTIYKLGNFIDFCRGPHLKSTGQINPDAFKLTKIAGAYWRGDEKNPMLTRIYGVAFQTKKALDQYLEKQKQAEQRDHRKLGQKLELFIFDEEVGAGLPLWLPKGATLRHIIENYLYEELLKQGYQWLVTPHIASLKLWQHSGHLNFFKENMYSPIEIEEEKYLLKPMNCPFHIKTYQSKIRSWRDLPLYLAELGTVYRYERSGVLHGLVRVRGFTQDDAHIFCTPQQLEEELLKLIRLGIQILKKFGFSQYDIYLSTRPEKYIGSLKIWQKATKALEYALQKAKLKYQIDPGEGIFYGPKIDIKIKDSLGRAWQCTTIQVDFNLPEKFKISYVDKKGKKRQPIMIHRALLGSIERFIGVLLEHYAGALPFWLAPQQIWIIPVGSSHKKYAEKIGKMFQVSSFRFQVKDENETVSKKIRHGQLQKIPYMLVVGDKEMKSKTVRVRHRQKGDIGPMKIDKFIEKITRQIKNKK